MERVAAVGVVRGEHYGDGDVDKALEQGVNMTSHGGDMVMGGSRMPKVFVLSSEWKDGVALGGKHEAGLG